MRTHGILVTVTALLLAAGLAGRAGAGTISIAMTPTAQLENDTLAVTVQVANRGDEAAQSVVPTLHFRGKEVRGKGTPSLAPNATFEETLTLPAEGLGTGRWPYSVTIDYTDANQYPFQALHALAVSKDTPPPPKVTIPSIEGTTIADSGTLEIKVKNMAGVERKVAVGVLVPEGLEVTQKVPDLTLSAWEEKVVSVPVANRTALAGSRLPIFVTVEYDDDGAHEATIGQNVVEIVPAQSFFAEKRVLLWLGAGLLVLAWGGFLVARVARRR
jgi:hypothetical protein